MQVCVVDTAGCTTPHKIFDLMGAPFHLIDFGRMNRLKIRRRIIGAARKRRFGKLRNAYSAQCRSA